MYRFTRLEKEMLFLGKVLIALLMAVLFTLIFTLVFKRPGPWTAWWAFFVIIFLVSLAGALWITPMGPLIMGIYWLPIILVAFIFAALLASIRPPTGGRVETISQVKEKEVVTETMFDVFFWLLLILLVLAIIFGYLRPGSEAILTPV